MVVHTSRKVFLFGPHALSFNIQTFNNLRTQIHDDPSNRWVLDLFSQLPNIWSSLVDSVPTLQHLNGEELLQTLNQGLQTGDIPESIFPLPNILLTPLVVVVQLLQYSTFLKAAVPELSESDELPTFITETTEILGLCTGILSSLAVACSSSLSKLQHYGSVAVRLAIFIGALVDANDASPNSKGNSVSFSMSWNGAESSDKINKVLEKFPEVRQSLLIQFAL
jgi:hypothetical protein